MRLKEVREKRGITQRQAAIGLNLSPTVYNRYENGIREPSNVVLLAMADYFNVSVDEILGREETKKDPPLGEALDNKLIDMLTSLTPDQVQRVLDFVAGMKATNKE